MRKKKKKYQTLKFFSSLVSLTRHFTKFIFLEQLTAMPQFNMQNMLFFFFLSSHYDTNPLLHVYHLRKKYNYILAYINSQSSRVMYSIFSFCVCVGGGDQVQYLSFREKNNRPPPINTDWSLYQKVPRVTTSVIFFDVVVLFHCWLSLTKSMESIVHHGLSKF